MRNNFSAGCQRSSVSTVRDCGRFPIKLHKKLKRTTDLRIPQNPILHLHFVTTRASHFLIIC